jgi:hypothetical protein
MGRLRLRTTEVAVPPVPQRRRVAREKRRKPWNALAFWASHVSAFARFLSARGEKLANPFSR